MTRSVNVPPVSTPTSIEYPFRKQNHYDYSVEHPFSGGKDVLMRFAGKLLIGVWKTVNWLIRLGLLVVVLQSSSFPIGTKENAITILVDDVRFDYVQWELEAIATKFEQTLYGLHPFMTETARSQYVRDYLGDLAQAQSLDAQINAVFADSGERNPEGTTADLRAQRNNVRADLNRRQPLAESILEGQVASVLVEQGFGVAGQVLPPVSAHFTRVPSLLVVSPRDQIRFDVSINLNPMSVDEIDKLEALLDSAYDVSSLVVPLGGIALYPAMILETASIPYALDTIAHEWLHHYLFFYPLGLGYFGGEGFAGETRIINETTAVLFGQEMSRLVLAEYYPEFITGAPAADLVLARQADPTRFDFVKEMDTTRRHVDDLLAQGRVEAAESYMSERREVFVANGYLIRKLNQAYFAFYGGYQAGPSAGAGGRDPIGPAVRRIRDSSESLYEWILTMRNITTRDELLRISRSLNPESS
jgi:hypothetical protein